MLLSLKRGSAFTAFSSGYLLSWNEFQNALVQEGIKSALDHSHFEALAEYTRRTKRLLRVPHVQLDEVYLTNSVNLAGTSSGTRSLFGVWLTASTCGSWLSGLACYYQRFCRRHSFPPQKEI